MRLAADDLDLASGLVLLLERMLDRLAEGEELEVTSREPSVSHDLPAWCRFAGHVYLGKVEREGGEVVHRVRRGKVRRLLLRDAPPGGADAIPAHADPPRGFAPRGARVVAGAPAYPFSLVDRDKVWADDVRELYTHAVTNQWVADRDLPWSARGEVDRELEQAVAQIMTFLAENELSALYAPARFLPRIHPHFAEVALFIATQLADEARHIEAFTRRAAAGGFGPQASSASTQASLRTLIEQEDFTACSFLLSVLGEGTFVDLLRFIEEHAPDPLTRELCRRARHDEARHVRFGVAHVRYALASSPEAPAQLARAAAERARTLAGVTQVNPLVSEALAILAAGSLRAADVRRGVAAQRALLATMHDNRMKRLVACGFSPAQAEELSSLHTPNFM
jgi:TusA-related sulfurtransferase